MDNGQPQDQQPQPDYRQPLPEPSTLPPTPKKRFTPQAIVIALLSLLLLASVAALAYVLTTQDAASNSTATPTTSSEQKTEKEAVKEDAPAAVEDKYVGWKTFSKDWKELEFASASQAEQYDFRYPAGWAQGPISDCTVNMGPTSPGGGERNFACLSSRPYLNGQTFDAYVASQIANGHTKYKDLTIDGHKAVMLLQTRSANDKSYTAYVDKLTPVNSNANMGPILSCHLRASDTSSYAEFLNDCEKLIESVKFLK